MKLKPVSYTYNYAEEKKMLGVENNEVNEGSSVTTYSGFIAQQVDQAAQSIGYNFSGIDKYGKIWGLRYAEFVPALVKALQEQQTVIIHLEQSNSEEKDRNSKLQEEIQLLRTRIDQLDAKLK
jgi:hypothetical protein